MGKNIKIPDTDARSFSSQPKALVPNRIIRRWMYDRSHVPPSLLFQPCGGARPTKLSILRKGHRPRKLSPLAAGAYPVVQLEATCFAGRYPLSTIVQGCSIKRKSAAIRSSASHVNGSATALLRFDGRRQGQDIIGRRLFTKQRIYSSIRAIAQPSLRHLLPLTARV